VYHESVPTLYSVVGSQVASGDPCIIYSTSYMLSSLSLSSVNLQAGDNEAVVQSPLLFWLSTTGFMGLIPPGINSIPLGLVHADIPTSRTSGNLIRGEVSSRTNTLAVLLPAYVDSNIDILSRSVETTLYSRGMFHTEDDILEGIQVLDRQGRSFVKGETE